MVHLSCTNCSLTATNFCPCRCFIFWSDIVCLLQCKISGIFSLRRQQHAVKLCLRSSLMLAKNPRNYSIIVCRATITLSRTLRTRYCALATQKIAVRALACRTITEYRIQCTILRHGNKFFERQAVNSGKSREPILHRQPSHIKNVAI
jgi:hypothetical protein